MEEDRKWKERAEAEAEVGGREESLLFHRWLPYLYLCISIRRITNLRHGNLKSKEHRVSLYVHIN